MLTLKFSKHNHSPEIEVFLTNSQALRQYREVEVSVSFYPYQRMLKADDFRFDPYEDYVADLVEGQRSTYQEIHSVAPQGFGLLLGGAIFSYFMVFHPQLLISVESLVSIFAAYTVGKEIWKDLDVFLQDRTQSWPVRWVQQSFYYMLQQFGTFQRFWQLARIKRYGYHLTLPSAIDFISHSNSKTIEMLFKSAYFPNDSRQMLRVLRILSDREKPSPTMLKKGLIICRLGLIQNFLGVKRVVEYYQAYDQGQVGTLDAENVWHPNLCLEKRFMTVGRLMWFTAPAKLVNKRVID